MMMEFDKASGLWRGEPVGHFFRQRPIIHREQLGDSCVSTGLSLLTGEAPDLIRPKLNTQDPVSWSRYLKPHGMKFAYCPTDFRRLKHYVPELLALDDLFAISTYSPGNPAAIGARPDGDGWICGSHFFILHRDRVYDTCHAEPIALVDYPGCARYVKRLFRIVPDDYPRGI